MPIHQRATSFNIYKKYSELKFSSIFNFILLIGFAFGVYSGVFITKSPNIGATLSESYVDYKIPGTNNPDVPEIWGDYIYFTDNSNNNEDIYRYKISTGTKERITADPSRQYQVSIYQEKIVWSDQRNGDMNIYYKNISTGEDEERITTTNSFEPDIYGDNIVYSNGDIEIYNLNSRSTSKITNDVWGQQVPRIYGNIVVWQDGRSGNYDIYSYDISVDTDNDGVPNYLDADRPTPDPAERLITGAVRDQTRPEIYGDNIVWQDGRDGIYDQGWDIYLYNLSNSTEKRISTSPNYEESPDIYENKIVYWDSSYSIYEYDIVTSETKKISHTSAMYPAIYENKIVWKYGYGISYTLSETDSVLPVFNNLPNTTSKTNLIPNQIISVNPLIFNINPYDEMGIDRLEVYVNNDLNQTMTGISGVTSVSIDTSNISNSLDGTNIIIRAFDYADNYQDLQVFAVLDPYLFPVIGEQETLIANPGYDVHYPYIEGNWLAWTTNKIIDGQNINRIEYKNLVSGEHTTIEANNNYGTPVIMNSKIYWIDSFYSSHEIYSYDIETQQIVRLTNSNNEKSGLMASDGKLVWQESRESNMDIYLYDISTLQEKRITTNSYQQQGPKISGNIITWDDLRDDHNIYYYDLSANQEKIIYGTEEGCGSYSEYPNVYDNKIIWTDWRNDCNAEIYMYNISTNQETRLTNDNVDQRDVVLFKNNYIFYEINDDIYAYSLDLQKQFKITSTNGNSPTSYSNGTIVWEDSWTIKSASFWRLDIIGPEISVSAPESVNTGEGLSVTLSATDNVNISTAKFMYGNNGQYIDMAEGQPGQYSYNMIVPTNYTGNQLLTFKAYDSSGNLAIKYKNINIIDNIKPTINSIKNTEGSTGDNTTVTVNATDNISLNSYISINAQEYQEMLRGANNNFTYTIKVPINSTNDISYQIKAVDYSNNYVLSDKINIKIIDNDPPEITSVEPQKNGETLYKLIVLATDNIAPTKAAISFDNNLWVNMSGESSPFSYYFGNIEDGIEGKENYYVRVYDAAGNYDTTDPNKVPFINSEPALEEPNESILTQIQGAFRKVIENTPEQIAKNFPYFLFATLIFSAFLFMRQTSIEAEQISIKKQMIDFRKIIVEEKDNFIMLTSHYIRTPITMITGGIDQLSGKVNGDLLTRINTKVKELINTTEKIIKEMENNKSLHSVIKPDVKKESIKIYLSPMLWLPIVFIALLSYGANYLFQNIGDIQLTRTNLITQAVIFLIVVQVFIYFYRKNSIQKINNAYFDKTIEYQVSLDEAKNNLMIESRKSLTALLEEIKNILGKKTNKYIEDGYQRMYIILDKISYLSTLKYTDAQKSKKSIKVNDVIKKLKKEFSKEIKDKKIKIITDPTIITSNKKEKIIYQIIYEIFSNAIKFSPENGVINISTVTDNIGEKVIISDQGNGISKKELLYLYKPFSRTHSALNFDYEGLGLGLYYAKSLANMIGGDISINSSFGKGTEVTIVI